MEYHEVSFKFKSAELQTPAPRVITSLRFYQQYYPRLKFSKKKHLLSGEQLPLFGKITIFHLQSQTIQEKSSSRKFLDCLTVKLKAI
jgi:hypothetical protein